MAFRSMRPKHRRGVRKPKMGAGASLRTGLPKGAPAVGRTKSSRKKSKRG